MGFVGVKSAAPSASSITDSLSTAAGSSVLSSPLSVLSGVSPVPPVVPVSARVFPSPLVVPVTSSALTARPKPISVITPLGRYSSILSIIAKVAINAIGRLSFFDIQIPPYNVINKKPLSRRTKSHCMSG